MDGSAEWQLEKFYKKLLAINPNPPGNDDISRMLCDEAKTFRPPWRRPTQSDMDDFLRKRGLPVP
jgi:hypothetical protein